LRLAKIRITKIYPHFSLAFRCQQNIYFNKIYLYYSVFIFSPTLKNVIRYSLFAIGTVRKL